MRILLIDNFDSFTYNLVQLFRESEWKNEVIVVDNTINFNDLPTAFDKVVISPGPGLPEESGNLNMLLQSLLPRYPVLGVCLGHQAIALAFGGRLKHLAHSTHGFRSPLQLKTPSHYLFQEIPQQSFCGRYHSWVVNENELPDSLYVTAVDAEGQVMAFAHRTHDICGVQFHPESYMTEFGQKMIDNWLAHK